MQLLKVVLFVCLIYCASAQSQVSQPPRDAFYFVDYITRRLIEAYREVINKECQKIILKQSQNFKTGWPIFKIGPIDPLRIAKLDVPLIVANLTLINADLSGIAELSVNDCDLWVFALYAKIGLHFEEIRIDGQHETTAKLGSIHYDGKGDAQIIFKGLNVTAAVTLGIKEANQLNLDDVTVNIKVDHVETHLTGFGIDIINKAVSALINEPLKLFVNAGNTLFELFFIPLRPAVNAALNQVTLPDFIANIVEFIQRYSR